MRQLFPAAGLALAGWAAAGSGMAQDADFSNVTVEKLGVDNFAYTEAPLWSKDGYLLFADVPNQKIWKAIPGQEPQVLRDATNGASGLTYDREGKLYVCESGAGRVVTIDANGKLTVLAESWEGKRLNGPNDIVVREDKHVYFTDPAFGNQQKGRQLDFYGIFHMRTDGKELELVAQWATRPNGIALAPDGRTLYVANSDERAIHAFDLDRRGRGSNDRVLIRGIDGVPNGLKVDEAGNIYVAAKAVAIYSADGKPIRDIGIQETPSNMAFGDDDFRSLYVTAQNTLYRVRVPVRGSVQY